MYRNDAIVDKFMADFETTTDPNDCRVWAWGVCEIFDTLNFKYGIDIDSFLEWCAEDNRIVYFHNLAFDGCFILDAIMKDGYIWRPSDDSLDALTFTTVIDRQGKFYTITVKWANGKTTEFRDSLKKLPMSVARIGKAYNTGLTKGSLDHESYRPVGHELTLDELAYLRNDVKIVAKALAMQFDDGMEKLTAGADSLAEYQSTISMKLFKMLFPVLTLNMDSEIRKGYRGGWTYANPKYAKRITGGGYVFDVNSLYPYVMYSRLLPCGEPEFDMGFVEPTVEFPLTMYSVTFTAKLKPNHLPCIQIKNSPFFLNTEYQVNISEPVTMVCTNVDWELWNDHYTIDVISFNGTYRFRGKHDMFKEYIDKWSEIKANSTGGRREIAKLHLNSLYGKFATNPDVTGKHPILNDNVVTYEMNDLEQRKPIYTAMGVFITAYAREITIRAAQANYDIFAYADTDSLHLVTDKIPENLDVHPTRLGAWKLETKFNSAFYARPKAYCEKISGKRYHKKHPNDEYITHVAGLPVSIASKVTLSDFTNGRIFQGKLRPRRVSGGVVLEPVSYTLKW